MKTIVRDIRADRRRTQMVSATVTATIARSRPEDHHPRGHARHGDGQHACPITVRVTWTPANDADDRLAIMLEFMERAGLSATGETRSEGPPEALDLVARGPAGPFDAVLVVWRQQKHRWLFSRKGEGFEESLGIPVEAIQADPPVRHSNVEDPEELRELFQELADQRGWLNS